MFKDDLTAKVKEYTDFIPEMAGQTVSPMLIDFVIEKYAQHRNYPLSFKDDLKENDMYEHITTIAMAVVDMLNKIGAEGEKSHSENGVSRQYESAYVSTNLFYDVLPYVNIF